MVKKGDTLIEVALAVGIFSMVAISIVSVMNRGASNAQTALETTMAREQIDIQAETLRFIHSAYLSEKENPYLDDSYRVYTRLWNKITENAYHLTGNPADDEIFLKYHPSTCQDVYSGIYEIEVLQKAFVVNPRALRMLLSNENDAYIAFNSANGGYAKFKLAQTYPRLVYGANSADPLLEEVDFNWHVYGAEGIYVLAVADPNSTNTGSIAKESAYYDFYIRTCWYSSGSESPSTISTVIRLYNPDAINQ